MMDRNKQEQKKVISKVRGGGLYNFNLNAENDDKRPIRLQICPVDAQWWC